MGIERIYVYESVYEQFVRKASAEVAKLRVGAPYDVVSGHYADVDVGCITTAPQLALIDALVKDAVSKGARLIHGGKILYQGPVSAPAAAATAAPAAAAAAAPAESSRGRGKSPARPRKAAEPKEEEAGAAPAAVPAVEAPAPLTGTAAGLFYAPTLLADVDHSMRIANEEVFGPVMAIFKVPRDSDEACIAMANSTEYGLGGTVYSGSPARANAIAARLHTGMVGINAFGLNYLVQSLPFGGVKSSGFDRFAGPEGLRACCLLRSVVTDKLGFLSIPTPTPAPLQYPVSKHAPDFTKSLIGLQFAPSTWGRILALFGVILNSHK